MSKKNRCTNCKCYFLKESMISVTVGKFCTQDCIKSYGMNKPRAVIKKDRIIKAKKQRFDDSQKKKELMSRKKWFDRLQSLVNQYVLHVRDKDKPCCTCGTTNPNIKYDAGHCFTRGGRSDIQFNLFNIHKQCSQICNVFGAGKQEIHKLFIAENHGQEVFDSLVRVHPDLKTQFPNWQDIELEILRYRILLREHGVTPRV